MWSVLVGIGSPRGLLILDQSHSFSRFQPVFNLLATFVFFDHTGLALPADLTIVSNFS